MTEDEAEQAPRVKQVIVIRRDLNMRRGKEIAQGAHASMMWLTERLDGGKNFCEGYGKDDYRAFSLTSFSEPEWLWVSGNFRKITCQVPSEAALRELVRIAGERGVIAHLVVDSGLTEFGGQETVTALAIGPDWDWRVDQVTADLRLY